MHYLGIDYGQKKIGLALAEGRLAEPDRVIRFASEDEAIRKIKEVVKREKTEKIILGVSEGRMKEEARSFGQKLKAKLAISVELFDETLTTKEAQSLAIKAGIKRSKRKKMEDAYSAALILQNYLDRK